MFICRWQAGDFWPILLHAKRFQDLQEETECLSAITYTEYKMQRNTGASGAPACFAGAERRCSAPHQEDAGGLAAEHFKQTTRLKERRGARCLTFCGMPASPSFFRTPSPSPALQAARGSKCKAGRNAVFPPRRTAIPALSPTAGYRDSAKREESPQKKPRN